MIVVGCGSATPAGDGGVDASADAPGGDAGLGDAPLDVSNDVARDAGEAGACVADLAACVVTDTCCTSYYTCRNATCQSCLGVNEGCVANTDCCSHKCAGTCQ